MAEEPPGQEVVAPQVPMAQPTSLSHMLRDTPARRAAQGLRKNPPQSEGDRALRIEGSEGQVPLGGRSQSEGDRALRIEGSDGQIPLGDRPQPEGNRALRIDGSEGQVQLGERQQPAEDRAPRGEGQVSPEEQYDDVDLDEMLQPGEGTPSPSSSPVRDAHEVYSSAPGGPLRNPLMMQGYSAPSSSSSSAPQMGSRQEGQTCG